MKHFKSATLFVFSILSLMPSMAIAEIESIVAGHVPSKELCENNLSQIITIVQEDFPNSVILESGCIEMHIIEDDSENNSSKNYQPTLTIDHK